MTLINTGCGLAGLRSLVPGSVDLVFCDLPSGETRAHFDTPIDLAEFWPAAWACLKPSGAVVLMASSLRYAAQVIASEPKWYRYDLIWEKGRATGHFNAARRPMLAHEYVLVFYREQPTYNAQKTAGHGKAGRRVRSAEEGAATGSANYGTGGRGAFVNDGGTTREPRSVILT